MTYNELVTAVSDYSENTFPTSVMNTMIQQAEQRIYNSVQLANLRKNVTGSLTSGNKYLQCPNDFLSVYSLAIIKADGSYEYLLDKDVNFIRQAYPNPSDRGISARNCGCQRGCGRVCYACLAVNPHLNWTAGGILVWNAHVRWLRDAGNRHVTLCLARTGTCHCVQQVDGVRWDSIDGLASVHYDLALLNRPQVDATVGPFNRQKVQRTTGCAHLISGAQLLTATLKGVFNQLGQVQVEYCFTGCDCHVRSSFHGSCPWLRNHLHEMRLKILLSHRASCLDRQQLGFRQQL